VAKHPAGRTNSSCRMSGRIMPRQPQWGAAECAVRAPCPHWPTTGTGPAHRLQRAFDYRRGTATGESPLPHSGPVGCSRESRRGSAHSASPPERSYGCR
jgi:hypothetical protein